VSVKFNKRGGYYFVDITWPDGIRTRPQMPDEDTAKKLNKKIEVAIVDEDRIWKRLRKELRLARAGITSFEGFCDHYFKLYVSVHNRDTRVKASRLEVLKEHFKASLESVTLRSVTQFVSEKKSEGVKNATINRYLSLLHHMTTWAVKQGILEDNPLAQLEKLEEVEWVGMRPDEAIVDEIFAVVDARVLPVFVFLRETGCRRGEAITLRLAQIDFARQNVTFHTTTKNGRSRQVPLTSDAIWAVQAMPTHGPTVFYHPDYMEPWTGDGLAEYWQKARKAAGYPALRIHDLRHAYGIKLAEEGCSMHFISEVMGHHSIDFTRKKYARFSPGSASKAVLRVLEGRKAAKASESG
jgi:integrase